MLHVQFDGILEGAAQDTVYATCAQQVADSLLAGYNGTVFCYGQVNLGCQALTTIPPPGSPHRVITPPFISLATSNVPKWRRGLNGRTALNCLHLPCTALQSLMVIRLPLKQPTFAPSNVA